VSAVNILAAAAADADREEAITTIANLVGLPDAVALLRKSFDRDLVPAAFKLLKVAAALGIRHFGFTYAMLLEELDDLDDDEVFPDATSVVAIRPSGPA
jgi:hypothetical protein